MADIKIAMLAPSNSGKTCFLSAMYGKLSSLSRSTDHNLHYDFIERAKGIALKNNLLEIYRGNWPQGTREIERYNIEIREKSGEAEKTVQLIDFPGITLNDIPDEAALQKTFEVLAECNAFITLLDAGHIKTFLGQGQDEQTKAMRDLALATTEINNVIKKAISKRNWGNIGIPIAFCISKYDLLNQKEGAEAKEAVKSMFPECFESGYNHPILLTGTTLGENIASGQVSPQNMEAALMFVLKMAALAERDEHNKTAGNYGNRESEYSNKSYEENEKIKERESWGIFEGIVELFSDEKKADMIEKRDSHRDSEERSRKKRREYETRASSAESISDAANRQLSTLPTTYQIY